MTIRGGQVAIGLRRPLAEQRVNDHVDVGAETIRSVPTSWPYSFSISLVSSRTHHIMACCPCGGSIYN